MSLVRRGKRKSTQKHSDDSSSDDGGARSAKRKAAPRQAAPGNLVDPLRDWHEEDEEERERREEEEEEEEEFILPDPDSVLIDFLGAAEPFVIGSSVMLQPAVALAGGETFFARVVKYNDERRILKLQYEVKDPKMYDLYANQVLKVGTTIISADCKTSATIGEMDAEWHRHQPWAKQNDHLGKHVRWEVEYMGKIVEQQGVVWGFLPADESEFYPGAPEEEGGEPKPLWRVVFSEDVLPADLEEHEVEQALEMYRRRDTRDASAAGKTALKRSKGKYAQEEKESEEWHVDMAVGGAGVRGAASANREPAGGAGRVSDKSREESRAKAAEKEKEKEREREKDKDKDKKGEKERDVAREREKRALEAQEWVQALEAEVAKADPAGVPAMLAPRLARLKDARVAHDASRAGETIQALNEVAARIPHVFAVDEVLEACLGLLAWSAGAGAPKDGIVQHQLVCQWLMAAYEHTDLWPTALVQAYLNDALESRRWVDIPHAAPLVGNIVTAFPSPVRDASAAGVLGKEVREMAEHDQKRRKVMGGSARAGAGALAAAAPKPPEDGGTDAAAAAGIRKAAVVRARFRDAAVQQAIADMALAAVRKSLDQPQYGDSAQRKLQHLLRVLVLLVPYERVRHEAMKRLESWVNNALLVRQVKELLPRLAAQCKLSTETEAETLRLMLRMRPKANATQIHNEALGILCRANKTFALRALMTSIEIELKDYESFTHKNNKTLRQSHAISAVFKYSGAPHFTVDLPASMGGGVERWNTVDLGLGQVEYDVAGPLKLWGSVMGDGKQAGDLHLDAKGAIVVASEEEVCAGSKGEPGAMLVEAAARRAHAAHASALVVIASRVLRGGNVGNMGGGQMGAPALPVVAISPGEDVGLLRDVAQEGMQGALSRMPREALLANCFQVLADSGDKRAGLPLLLRKIIKTCKIVNLPDFDLVGLARLIMTPHENVHVLDPESKALWASALADVVNFICIHLVGLVIEASQAPVHAERGGGAVEARSERVAEVVRGQVMQILDVVLETYVHSVLKSFLPREALAHTLRKLLFYYEEASAYAVEPLLLETHERHGIKWLQNEMSASGRSLVALARLGVGSGAAAQLAVGGGGATARIVDPTTVLELVELLVRRALPLAARHALARLPGGDARKAADARRESLVLSQESVCLWEILPVLARGDEAGQSQLAPRARAWQVYLILLILAVLNPKTLGKLVWEQSPTLRAMMQMLITASFAAPADHSPLAQLDALEADARRVEEVVIGKLRAQIALKGVLEPQWLQSATIFETAGGVRCPPKETLMELKILDKDEHLGHLLRMAQEPSMLLETIAAHGDSAWCVGWLGSVLRRYPQTASSLPVSTICELLFANLAAVPPAGEPLEPGDGGSTNVTSLAMRLAQCICEGERRAAPCDRAASEATWQGLLFFLERLGAEDEAQRRRAVVALGLVLACVEKFRKSSHATDAAPDMGAASEEEEELLAGGGGGEGEQEVEQELLAGGVDGEVKVLADGGRGGGSDAAYDDAAGPASSLPWLSRLVRMPGVPVHVHEKVVLVLRGALLLEPEAEVVLQYLEYLRQAADLSAGELSRDVALLVLRRRVLIEHMCKLPSATFLLLQILLNALKVGSGEGLPSGGSDAQLVKVPGSLARVPLIVVRAGLQALCLHTAAPIGREGRGGKVESAREHEELLELLLPDELSLVSLGLPDEETASLLQSPCSRIAACAAAAASEPQLVAALSLCGITAHCLAAIVKRIKASRVGLPAPLAATLRTGMGARAISLLRREHPRESQWLADQLGITLTAPRKLPALALAPQRPAKRIDIDASQPVSVPAGSGTKHPAGASRNLLQVPPASRLAALVEAETTAASASLSPRPVSELKQQPCPGKAGARVLRWASVLKELMEGEDDDDTECGLRMDFLAAVNPLLWPAEAGLPDASRLWEWVFRLPSASMGAGGMCQRRRRAASRRAALAGPLLLHGAADSCYSCVRWLLGETTLNPSTGAMHAARRSDAGDTALGPEVDCSLCLQVLSAFIVLESGALEGAWGEGGGGEVSETRTRRENLGLNLGHLSWRRRGATASALAASEDECVTMLHYLLSEASRLGGCVAMGRMQLIVLLLRQNNPAAVAVSRTLRTLAALSSSKPPCSRKGCLGVGLGAEERIARAALDVHERLHRALPLLMASADNAIAPPAGGPSDGDVWGEGDRPRLAPQQTSRLDRLLHNTMTALQGEGGKNTAAALHVARHLAAAQPSLVAKRMLLLKGMCAGKVLLSLSDLVERGHHTLLLNVLAVLEAAAPHSLRCRRLPLVLDEYFLLFSSIVRYEAVLEPLLLGLAGLLLRLVPLGGAAAEYVRRQVPLLSKLAAWFLTIPELTAVLDLLDVDVATARPALVSVTPVDPLASRLEQLVAILRRWEPGGGALLQALVEAEALTASDVRADLRASRLSVIESPLVDLMTDKAAQVRDAAYRLLFRSALLNSSCASRFADKHIECLLSDNEPVRQSAIAHSAEMTLACSVAAPRVLSLLFRLARAGHTEARTELMRGVKSGLDFHCIASR